MSSSWCSPYLFLRAGGLLAWVARFMSVCRWAGSYFWRWFRAEPRDKIRHTMVTPGSHGELSYISSSLAASSREVPGVLAGMEFWLVRRWFWNSGHAGHAFCHNWTTAYYNIYICDNVIYIYLYNIFCIYNIILYYYVILNNIIVQNIIYELVSWAVDGGAAGVDFSSVFFADTWYT